MEGGELQEWTGLSPRRQMTKTETDCQGIKQKARCWDQAGGRARQTAVRLSVVKTLNNNKYLLTLT